MLIGRAIGTYLPFRGQITSLKHLVLKTWVEEFAISNISVSIARGLFRIAYIKSFFSADIHLNKFLVKLIYHF
jgi:hypothetical protein